MPRFEVGKLSMGELIAQAAVGEQLKSGADADVVSLPVVGAGDRVLVANAVLQD